MTGVFGKGGLILAIRPVFVVSLDERIFIRENVEFEYHNGFSEKQKVKCINNLHQAFSNQHLNAKVLEISSKSQVDLGVMLSAFNLMINTKGGSKYSVESAFQASKVFEKGGPYKDLLKMTSREAKKDERLKSSGKVIAFHISDKIFPAEPKTYFYNWLYVNTLYNHSDLSEMIMEYDSFTDIVFNPQKSINCQAEAAAIFVSLKKQSLLQEALKSKESFLEIVYNNTDKKNDNQRNIQLSLF